MTSYEHNSIISRQRRLRKNSYRDNCSGRLIEDIISQYRLEGLSNFMVGSGTTEDVVRSLDFRGSFADLSRGTDMLMEAVLNDSRILQVRKILTKGRGRNQSVLQRNYKIMNLIRKHYGTIELGKSVILSDPCYEPDIWCSAKVRNMIPGIYDCYADFTEIEHWGTRVARLVIIIDNPPHEAPKKVKEVNACLAVDAGVFGIYDEKYFRKKKSENPDAWYEQNVLS